MNFKNSFFPGNKIIYNILVSKIAQKANKKKTKENKTTESDRC